jgi:hypothetical protein
MNHKELVKRAQAWLTNTRHCTIVLSELKTRNTETPDGIGFSGSMSYLIECKATRADFLADKNKIFRREEERGMGNLRYFMVPAGKIVTPDEVPDPWGLIEVYPSDYPRTRKEALPAKVDKSAEVIMLVSVIRRLELSTAVFVRHEEI